jgi:DNA gyrase/topoisomerase IV subunit A
MIRESDIQWWVLEAIKHPEAASQIIQELAKRLVELDAENERLRGELLRIRHNAPTPGTDTRVETLQRKVDTLQGILQRQEPTDTSLVLLSDRLQAVRVPLLRARELAAEGQPVLNPRAMLSLHSAEWAGPGDELLVLTNQGRGFRRLVADVPFADDAKRWPAAPDGLTTSGGHAASEGGLGPGERPTAILATSAPPRFWTIVTRRGYVQRLVRVACDQQMARGEPLLASPIHNDEPAAIISGDLGDVLVITRWGKAVRFAQRVIETQGSIALDLDTDDQVAAALALDSAAPSGDSEILLATASGYCMRRSSADVPARTRAGGTGKALIQAHDVLTAFLRAPASPEPELLFVTYGGSLVFASTQPMPLHERLSKGTLLHDLGRDPAITVTLVR